VSTSQPLTGDIASRKKGGVVSGLGVVTLVLGVAALVAVVVLAGFYFKRNSQRGALDSDIAETTEQLKDYDSKEALQQRLEEARARLDQEKAFFPQELSSGDVLDSVLALASDSGVNVVSLNTQPAKEENRGEHTYSALFIDLEVQGSLQQLEKFLEGLEGGTMKTVALQEISLVGMDSSPSVSLEFYVYARS
jgi:Tfp pilus assembly protein PilO